MGGKSFKGFRSNSERICERADCRVSDIALANQRDGQTSRGRWSHELPLMNLFDSTHILSYTLCYFKQ